MTKRGKQKRVCVRCGKKMKGTLGRKYCSTKCRVYAWREKQDELRQAAKEAAALEELYGPMGSTEPAEGPMLPTPAMAPHLREQFIAQVRDQTKEE